VKVIFFFTKQFRDHSKNSIGELQRQMNSLCDDYLLVVDAEYLDVDSCTKIFHDSIYKIYDICCPIRSKRISYKSFSKPWISNQLKTYIHRKHRMYKEYRRGIIMFHDYNTFKNQVTNMVRRAKSRYFHDKFNANQRDIGDTWKTINSLIKKKRNLKPNIEIATETGLTRDNISIANIFNRYFTNIATELESRIPDPVHSPLSYMGDRVAPSFFISPVSEDDIRAEIDNLKLKSCNFYSIPTYVYKACRDSLSVIIAKLFNLSITRGTFPQCLKTARVIPIFKHGEPTSPNNYRPISTLSVLSKIFEKLMQRRLSHFLKMFNVLSPHQFGFKPNSSTSDAILEFLHTVVSSLDDKNSVIATFLDFAKAFDTIRHDILLNKLEHYGIRGVVLGWFKSYLCERNQFVCIGESKSGLCRINSGVPQGSVLGPTLFLLYINDMARCSNRLQFVHFADDTTVFCSNRDVEELTATMNLELIRLYEWLRDNRLILNVDKTLCMLFSDSTHNHVPNIIINNSIIRRVDVANFLGVKIDYKLTFRPHVDDLCKNISRAIGVINRISTIVPPKSKKMLYYALVHSRVSYGILAWGRSRVGNDSRVERLLRRARKVVCYPSTDASASSVNLLDFDSMYSYFACIKMFRIVKMGQHPYFSNFLQYLIPQHAHETRFSISSSFNAPQYNKTKSQKFFLYQSITDWNNLPIEMKSSHTLDGFKRQLKKKLLGV